MSDPSEPGMADVERAVDRPSDPVEATVSWLHRHVVGLDLCPFAAAPLAAGAVRVIASRGQEAEEVLAEVLVECERLQAGEASTTLIVVPSGYADFDDFLDLVAAVEGLLSAVQLDGEVQLASFHPDWVYAETPADDPANNVSRSPFPALHLLRHADVRRAVEETPDIAEIPERNAALMRELAGSS